MAAGKWKDLREQTIQNRKDKKFWTLLLKDVLRYTPKKTRGHALRRKFG